MRQQISVTVRLPDDADAGDQAQVYWDDFGGEVDYDTPLLAAPVNLLRAPFRQRGWCASPWCGVNLAGPIGAPCGWCRVPWVYGRWVSPDRLLSLRFLAPRGYGLALFGVAVSGPTGDVVGDPYEFVHLVSSEDPAPPASAAFDEYVSETDQVVLAFIAFTE